MDNENEMFTFTDTDDAPIALGGESASPVPDMETAADEAIFYGASDAVLIGEASDEVIPDAVLTDAPAEEVIPDAVLTDAPAEEIIPDAVLTDAPAEEVIPDAVLTSAPDEDEAATDAVFSPAPDAQAAPDAEPSAVSEDLDAALEKLLSLAAASESEASDRDDPVITDEEVADSGDGAPASPAEEKASDAAAGDEPSEEKEAAEPDLLTLAAAAEELPEDGPTAVYVADSEKKKKKKGCGCAPVFFILVLLAAAVLWLVYTYGPWVYFDGKVYNTSDEVVDVSYKEDMTVDEYELLSSRLPDSLIVWDVPIAGERRLSTETSLDFSGRDDIVFDDFIAQTAYFSDLRSLDMTGTGMTAGQFDALTAANPDCKIKWSVPVGDGFYPSDSKELDLSGEKGLTYDGLRSALGYFDGLSSVDLSGCGLENKQLRQLRSEVCSNIWWTVEGYGSTYSSRDKDVTLDLIGQEVDINELADFICCFENAVEVTIAAEVCGDDQLAVLLEANPDAEIRRVATLFGELYDINAESISAEDVEVDEHDKELISKFVSLRSLELIGCKTGDLSFLSGLETLESLRLVGCGISDISALETLSGLTALDLSGNELKTLPNMASFKELYSLTLDGNEINDFDFLDSLPKVEKLSLQGCALSNTSALANKLSFMPSLKELDISGNDIQLIAPFTKISGLEVLRANNCGLSQTPAFASFLNLRELYIESNGIVHITTISGMETLEVLDLANNSIRFTNELEGMTWLKKLDISGNSGLTADKAEALAEKLTGCEINF